jgi:leader peptidase (prepilin peptidase)/N-methyltransferase
LNVLADRLPREESVVRGRSHCEKCKKTLQWYDLIPLVSFTSLKGRCRYCHTRLSLYYPIIELTTGILFVLAFILTGFRIYDLGFMIFIFSALIVIFFTDLKYGIIPDVILLPSIVISFSYLFLSPNSLIINHLLSAFGASLFFLLLFLITKGKGMGLGDVKFAFLMGLILGFPDIVISLYIAFLTGAIIGVTLILWKKRKMSGATIPFGPFLVLGTLTALFWGEIIFQKTISLLTLH